MLLHQKIFLSLCWTCFSFVCAQRIRKNSSNCAIIVHKSQCKYRTTFSISTSSKSRQETSSPRFNSTCHFVARGDTAHRKHPEASQEPEMVEFLPRLHLQRWTPEARDVRVEAFFGVLTFCRIPEGTRITPAHLWSGFLRAWSKIGPFERSSSRCGQPMFWLHAHVKK